MIPASRRPHQRNPLAGRWQREVAGAVTDPAELLDLVGLGAEWLEPARRAAARFPLRVPRSYVARMRRGDASDPLLRQVLPLGLELEDVPGFVQDPVGDRDATRGGGVLQKYAGRALLVATGACAVHCRYCFRREFPYADALASASQWRAAVDAIRADASLAEVILSGGDPLSLADHKLAALTEALAEVPHVRRLRVHTRQPIVLPSRVDAGLLDWIANIDRPVTFVLHANHAAEIDDEVASAVARLRDARVHVLNQSVLLRGVNDSVGALHALSERLHDAGVLPYYLHVLDRVRGSAHFDVPEAEARRLHAELTRTLPGYLVPRLVREVPGAPSKVSIPSGGSDAGQ